MKYRIGESFTDEISKVTIDRTDPKFNVPDQPSNRWLIGDRPIFRFKLD